MMQKLLIATRNKGKTDELSRFLSQLDVLLVSLKDLGIDLDVKETGKTYKENSQKKAIFYAHKSGFPAIADDGGIEIAALNGAPGVKSRRWLGHEATDQTLINHMIKISSELPDSNRRARFVTVVSFALPNGKVWSSYAEVRGEIARKPYLQLLEGYPYRSFFYIPKLKKYYHENQLSDEEEKLYNHRHKAIKKLIPIIRKELGV